nr:NIPSNAP family protein [uncultured Acidocella sp.]
MSKRYELATLSIQIGSAPKFIQAAEAYMKDGKGRLLGAWLCDVGSLNKLAILREFEDDADLLRERQRGLTAANPFGAADFLTRLEMESYAPFPNMPPVETGSFGGIYEIRSYVLKPGGLLPTFEGWAETLPGRTAISPLTIALYGLDGTPRITHIWPYADANARFARRAESVAAGVWPPRSAVWLTPEMQAGLYVPTAISPLR